MKRSLRKLLDGFLFGLGFSLSMVVVVGFLVVCGTAFVVKKGFGTMAKALSEGTTMEQVEGVSLVSSKLTRRGEDIEVSASVTNSTSSRLQDLMAYTELSRRDGTFVDFSHDPIELAEPLAQQELKFLFSGVDPTNLVQELTFKLQVFQKSEKE